MSESEYKKLVFVEYDAQMEARLLPLELLLPTPAKIKDLVVKFCERGSELCTGDEQILRSFVGEKKDVSAYRNAFQIGKADPFRQVVKVLTKRSVNTNIKYINLLALLIGFPSRPYHPNLKPVSPSQTGAINIVTAGGVEKQETLDEKSDGHQTKRNYPILLWFFPVLIVIGVGWYAISKKTVKRYTGREGCMIWADDHYEPIDCKDQSTTAPHYQINHDLVVHFKRITRPDTLTYKSIRKVWYSNYKGKVEFYTDSGANPLDTNFRVLPMTTHIFEKYVLHITN